MAELIDSYVKLLLHFDGVDAAVVDIDYSGQNHIPTFVNHAQLDTAQKKFGPSACLFDGTDDYVTVPASADFSVGAGNFTIDWWMYPTEQANSGMYAFNVDYRLGVIYHYGQGWGGAARNICVYASSNGSSWDIIHAEAGGAGLGTASLTLNAWNHVAIVRNGNNWMSFLNGIKNVNATAAGVVTDSSGNDFRMGIWGNGAMFFDGWTDEFRVSKGIARWTANFTPYPYEYHTIAKSQVF